MSACQNALEIGDRKEAITEATKQLQQGDVLVIAGKGHETWQEAGGRKIPFSDEDSVLSALEDAA